MKVKHIKRRTARFEMGLPARMVVEAAQQIPGVAIARAQFTDFGYRFSVAIQRFDGSRHAVEWIPRKQDRAPGYKSIRRIVRKLRSIV